MAAIVLRTWRSDPDLVRVIVREVARSPQLARADDEIGRRWRDRADRRARPGAGRAAAGRRRAARRVILYGALDEILTGWVLGQLPDREEDVARAERAVVDVVAGGLVEAAR